MKKNQGYIIPKVLLPAENVNLEKWACVACDQFSSQPNYWKNVEKFVGNAPSALNITLPEVLLEDENVSEYIASLKDTMRVYLQDGILTELPRGAVLTERHIGGKVRKGLLLAMDLEQYDYKTENKPLLRATEQTVLSRIPPRVEIRRGAAVELPHIMLLIDDEADSVIGPLHMQRNTLPKLYDFDLMMDGGRVEGWLVNNPKLEEGFVSAIDALPKRDNMQFCVGDGNHSLATAKAIWDEAKEGLDAEERESSPLRYALCEVINLRDSAVEFMPIHRVMFGVNPAGCVQYIVERLRERGKQAKLVFGRWRTKTEDNGTYQIPFLYRDGAGRIIIENPTHPLAVGEVQEIFDEYIATNSSAHIDYIHGDDAFAELAKQYDNIGFYFDSMDKSEFFDMIVKCGVLPKKTFSLGEAAEKRYYLEGRLLEYNETEMTEE
ncbi:MAG: DUF1015 domain-containing protein [Christensenella sp.]